MTPIEKAGRKLCRENEITECHWEIWRNTASGQWLALHIALTDLWDEIKKVLRINN